MTREDAASAGRNAHRSAASHWGGFLAAGAIGFLTDAAILEACIRLLHLHPLVARLLAISTAMVAAWLGHRTMTFGMRSRPSAAEFFRYATMAWTAAAINYAVFALVLLLRPQTWPLAALVAGSAVAAVFSYLAMRHGVFRDAR